MNERYGVWGWRHVVVVEFPSNLNSLNRLVSRRCLVWMLYILARWLLLVCFIIDRWRYFDRSLIFPENSHATLSVFRDSSPRQRRASCVVRTPG